MCIEHNELWIKVDFRIGIPLIAYMTGNDFDLARFYRDQGFVVVETTQRDTPVTFPLILRDCVGLVKQILCIRGFALTPYALYRQLRKS